MAQPRVPGSAPRSLRRTTPNTWVGGPFGAALIPHRRGTLGAQTAFLSPTLEREDQLSDPLIAMAPPNGRRQLAVCATSLRQRVARATPVALLVIHAGNTPEVVSNCAFLAVTSSVRALHSVPSHRGLSGNFSERRASSARRPEGEGVTGRTDPGSVSPSCIGRSKTANSERRGKGS